MVKVLQKKSPRRRKPKRRPMRIPKSRTKHKRNSHYIFILFITFFFFKFFNIFFLRHSDIEDPANLIFEEYYDREKVDKGLQDGSLFKVPISLLFALLKYQIDSLIR